MIFAGLLSKIRTDSPAEKSTKNLTDQPTEDRINLKSGRPEKGKTDPYAWMRGIDQDRIEAVVVAHTEYDLINQLIKTRAARHEVPELIYHISCMFDIVESACVAAQRANIERKEKRLRVMAWTTYAATVIIGGLFNVTPWVTSPETRTCILSGAAMLLGLSLYGRRLGTAAQSERVKSYPLRKATYISLHCGHLGIEVIVEELTQDQAKDLPKI